MDVGLEHVHGLVGKVCVLVRLRDRAGDGVRGEGAVVVGSCGSFGGIGSGVVLVVGGVSSSVAGGTSALTRQQVDRGRVGQDSPQRSGVHTLVSSARSSGSVQAVTTDALAATAAGVLHLRNVEELLGDLGHPLPVELQDLRLSKVQRRK